MRVIFTLVCCPAIPRLNFAHLFILGTVKMLSSEIFYLIPKYRFMYVCDVITTENAPETQSRSF